MATAENTFQHVFKCEAHTPTFSHPHLEGLSLNKTACFKMLSLTFSGRSGFIGCIIWKRLFPFPRTVVPGSIPSLPRAGRDLQSLQPPVLGWHWQL